MTKAVNFELTEVTQLPVGERIEPKMNEAALLQRAEVMLTVDLGTVRVNLKQLKDLKENDILALDQKVDEPFEIKWRDLTVARARLVAISGQLAVEIVEVCASDA